MLKYLRIAVTALSITACVLLIALWVRSYKVAHLVLRDASNATTVWLVSSGGQFTIATAPVHREFDGLYTLGQWTSYGPLPYSIFVMLFASSATLPWIKHFSLRTLLIATTLVAVVLGLIVAAR